MFGTIIAGRTGAAFASQVGRGALDRPYHRLAGYSLVYDVLGIK
ncbi:MAG TPA: hypothetical protein VMW19_03930 [Myxococcota bacterium]|nr:hypothetical protein [Myxococcota bacterium]